MNNIEIKMNSISVSKLIDFYHENINTFNPPLDTQVNSVEKYVQKLKNNAIIFEAWVKNALAGLIAAYFNNYETKTGFITSVIISPKYQRQGIAGILLEEALSYAKKKDFLKVNLEVKINNVRAISLYRKYGFKEISCEGESIIMEFIS